MLVTIFRAGLNIARPDWVRFRDVVAVLLDAASLAILYTLMFARTWVVPAAAASNAQHVANVVNEWAAYGIWAAAVIALAQAIKNLIRLYKNWRCGASSQDVRTRHQDSAGFRVLVKSEIPPTEQSLSPGRPRFGRFEEVVALSETKVV